MVEEVEKKSKGEGIWNEPRGMRRVIKQVHARRMYGLGLYHGSQPETNMRRQCVPT